MPLPITDDMTDEELYEELVTELEDWLDHIFGVN